MTSTLERYGVAPPPHYARHAHVACGARVARWLSCLGMAPVEPAACRPFLSPPPPSPFFLPRNSHLAPLTPLGASRGQSRILITTNVLSRGIDVPAVTLVIQYDMPVMKGGVCDPETYLHRVGRTGRFGRKGVALNLIHDDKEMKVLKQIETYFDRVGLIVEIPQSADPEEFEKLLMTA